MSRKTYKGKKNVSIHELFFKDPKKFVMTFFAVVFVLILLSWVAPFIAARGFDTRTVSTAWFFSEIKKLKGDLIGQSFDIYEYDANGALNFLISGDKVNLSQEYDRNGEETSYVKITIDGSEWNHVGSTLVFVEKGANMVTDFNLSSIVAAKTGSTGFMAVDRVINNYKNLIGAPKVAIVEAQHGQPILLFQGSNVYHEIPGNLPKMTLLMLDGKHVYIHRANINILPANVL